MDFFVLTLFPEIIETAVRSSITGRAIESGIINLETINIRDHAGNKYGKVDDSLYGGGTGMLMMCQPVYDAWERAVTSIPKGESYKTIYMSPKGRVFDQTKALELSKEENIIILCGHYEGVDERVIEEIADEEISIGDYVLTGGEIPACAVIDAVSRLVPDVLSEEAYTDESHMNYALEHPQYTKPAEWKSKKVPEVLLSGHHENISRWKKIMSLKETMNKRPDLFEKTDISREELEKLIEMENE